MKEQTVGFVTSGLTTWPAATRSIDMKASSPAFRQVRKTSAVDDVLEQLKGFFQKNRAVAGRRLPSERELARTLGVSRPTLREALRTLSLLGVVTTRQGSGTELANSGSNVLRTPLRFLLMLDQPSVGDLHETRELIDVFLAGRAAERRTPEDLRSMEAALQNLKVAMVDRHQGYVEPDFRFHQTLWAAAHHPILQRMMAGLQENVVELMDSVKPTVHDFQPSYDSHERIFDAIRRRNPRRARREMKVHHDMMTDELRHAKLIR